MVRLASSKRLVPCYFVARMALAGLASPTSARVGITLTLMTLSALVLCQVRLRAKGLGLVFRSQMHMALSSQSHS